MTMPSTTNKTAEKTLTPMMRQYIEIKDMHKDSILFYRMGDFYEMFLEDAVIASKALGIVLTSRNKNDDIPLCGVPYHSSEVYISKLIRAGYSVAICEQVGDPKAKGIVERKVVRTITQGTITNQSLIDEKENNFLVSIFSENREGKLGLSQLDISTGEFLVCELLGFKELEMQLSHIKPQEILLPCSLKGKQDFFMSLEKNESWVCRFVDDGLFELENNEILLKSFFKADRLKDLQCENMPNAVRAAGCALRYAQNTQKDSLGHITRLVIFNPSDYLVLDETTQRNLELTRNTQNNTKTGSLLWVLDKTKTPMGARRLKNWLLKPLQNCEEINRRLDGIEEIKNKHSLRENIRILLDKIKDIERIFSRVSIGQVTAKELIGLSASLEVLPGIEKHILDLQSHVYLELKSNWKNCEEIHDLINKYIVEDPPVSAKEGGFIKPGVDQKLDELRAIQTNGNAWMASFEQEERKRTGITSLKIKYNKVFGYFIEVTRANLKNVPSDYIRKQTTVNGERYITSKLKGMESEIISANDKIRVLELELFKDLIEKVSLEKEDILQATRNVSILDVILSLSQVALENGYSRPNINTSKLIEITDGRHPVLEQLSVETHFVANDTVLDGQQNRLMIITGPNMAGKSTYMRQVGLITIMAHIGCFVPAKKAKIGITDRVFTRVGASDNLLHGQSTFMVEMTETAQILRNATSKSLVILDEIGRGTSTFDGLSIAWAVAEELCREIKAKTLFATHYHELTELPETIKGAKNYKVDVSECDDEISFLYKVVLGGANESYGIAVAKLAGIPQAVLKRSKAILQTLEKEERINPLKNKPLKPVKTENTIDKIQSKQLLIFKDATNNNGLLEEIKSINLDMLTPIKALNKIAQWKEKAAKH